MTGKVSLPLSARTMNKEKSQRSTNIGHVPPFIPALNTLTKPASSLPTKYHYHSQIGLTQSASNDTNSHGRLQNWLVNTQTSHFSERSHLRKQVAIDSLDNASNYTPHHDKKKLQEMRRELILLFRFFCLDKNLIVQVLKDKKSVDGSGGIAREGKANFSEFDVHQMMTQSLSSVQDWLHELHTLHTENLTYKEKMAQLEVEST